jgi:hypothetical protein
MSKWSLEKLFQNLHNQIDQELQVARDALQHPGTKGDASEAVWLRLFQKYLPQRYQVCTGHVVDSTGAFSDQIDIIVFDRHYSPFIFDFMGATVVPAESVYAVFEAKQQVDARHISYARSKLESVRKLTRTSAEIPSASGPIPPISPQQILGGVLTLDSDWNPKMGKPLVEALTIDMNARNSIDIGCISAAGVFVWEPQLEQYNLNPNACATTLFILELTKLLQTKATVPMIDIDAYTKWLK